MDKNKIRNLHPVHAINRKLSESPAWRERADRIADRGYEKADQRRDKQAQNGRR